MSVGEAVARTVGRALRRRRAGEDASCARAPQLAAPATIRLSSPHFADGGPIPLRHSGAGRGDDVSPALEWSGLPEGTAQLLLVMEDCDVPLPRPVLHLVALLEPGTGGPGEATDRSSGGTGGVPDGALAAAAGAPGVRPIPGSGGRVGYHGPRPMAGHGVHHYGFHLYALDARVPDEPARPRLRALLPVVAGHVLAAGHLVGTQEHP